MDAPLLPLTYYQKQQLILMLDTCHVPWHMIRDRLSALISSSEMDRDKFFFHMVLQGSAAYNLLAYDKDKDWHLNYDDIQRTLYNKLELSLRGHDVRELYRYVWVWSLDNSVLVRSESWYTDIGECYAKGKSCRPSMDTFDGANAPFAQLMIESTCACYVTLTPWEWMKRKDFIRETPCNCVISGLKEQNGSNAKTCSISTPWECCVLPSKSVCTNPFH